MVDVNMDASIFVESLINAGKLVGTRAKKSWGVMGSKSANKAAKKIILNRTLNHAAIGAGIGAVGNSIKQRDMSLGTLGQGALVGGLAGGSVGFLGGFGNRGLGGMYKAGKAAAMRADTAVAKSVVSAGAISPFKQELLNTSRISTETKARAEEVRIAKIIASKTGKRGNRVLGRYGK